MGTIILLILALFFYFLPSYIGRNGKNSAAILALNAFLGWTILGWVGALVWAISTANEPVAYDADNNKTASNEESKNEEKLEPEFKRYMSQKDANDILESRRSITIRYEDADFNRIKRVIDVYDIKDGTYLESYCHIKNEPRTFKISRIKSWKFDEHFDRDPKVEKWWKTEGLLQIQDQIPWKRWVDLQK